MAPRYRDTDQLRAVMRETDVPTRLRREFTRFVEEEKRMTAGGSKNWRGDYPYAELREIAAAFKETKGL